MQEISIHQPQTSQTDMKSTKKVIMLATAINFSMDHGLSLIDKNNLHCWLQK
jgi:hypothetical protein